MSDANRTSDGELEYTGLMARAWDPLRGDTSDWEDRALFRDLIREIGEPVLDVGCGTGRLLLDFLADGVDIDGIEISADMLALLRAKATEAGLSVEGRVHEGAMESMDLPRRYRLVLVPSSSFQLLVDPDAAAEAMRRFHAHLEPGGTLVMPWIDLAADHPGGADDVFEQQATLPDGSVIRRHCRAWYDPGTGLESTDDRYELLRDGRVVAEERKVRDPAVRGYARSAIEALHEVAGFEPPTFLAEFTREPARGGLRTAHLPVRVFAGTCPRRRAHRDERRAPALVMGPERRLQGPRVTLRAPVPADLGPIAAIQAEPDVARWWPPDDAEGLRRLLLEPEADVVPWVIEHEGRVVGFIQDWEETDPDYRHAGIDLLLSTAAQGQGLGPEAIRTLAAHLIDVDGHHRLIIDPEAANERAIAAYRKVGFRPVGVMRAYQRQPDGSWADGLLMEMLADELVRDG